MTATLSFHGACGTVTGSRYLIDTGERRLLVDCGLFQGLKELRERNWRRPDFDPASVDAVVLTHAHIDHTGYLPRLAREGFRGPVHCTPATRELVELMLLDSAKLQEEDAEYANRHGFSKHSPALPLYNEADAREAISLLQPLQYGQWRQLGDGLAVRLHNAGHLLGSAHVEVKVGKTHTVLFSGDVGRYDVPLHSDPVARPPSDVLVVESTYGDRLHDRTPVEDQIRQAFAETFKRRGTVLIPSFAVGRTQLVGLLLTRLMRSGELPEAPIHVDSPMAAEATRIYLRYLQDRSLDDDLPDRLFERKVKFHRTGAESKHLNDLPGPRVIIAGNGMLTGGRVLHHLLRKLPDPDCLICLVGYQAAGTRGRALLEGAPSVRMHGRDVPARAGVLAIHGLSGHADADELVRWVRSGGAAPPAVFVTHGEPEAARALAGRLEKELGARCVVPGVGESRELG
jgi:metallo-beta-lactamase family protein